MTTAHTVPIPEAANRCPICFAEPGTPCVDFCAGERATPHYSSRAETVPLPEGGIHAGDWDPHDPMPSRCIYGPVRKVTDAKWSIETATSQWADGTVDTEGTWIEMSGEGLRNSDQARELAAALLEAADEVDGWATP